MALELWDDAARFGAGVALFHVLIGLLRLEYSSWVVVQPVAIVTARTSHTRSRGTTVVCPTLRYVAIMP
jgi:hypothetical protein